ncbi:MAG: long-chain fatty acid--CoA ligase [Gammaproteobacteria bacterium]|nr:MAG: long-chain fatty acid--CoA ligase [Gammaproteobacteria bacterium]
MNLALHLRRSALAFGERPAIAIGRHVVLDYGQLAARSAALAAALRTKLGLAAGSRVSLVMGNCAEYLELLYACWHAGLVAVPVNAKLHAKEIHYILAHSGAQLCFTTPALGSTLAEAVKGLAVEVIQTESTAYQTMLKHAPEPPLVLADDTPAWLFYTSGTTGRPKGAILSHGNLRAMSFCYFTDVDRVSPWRSLLHLAPMSHGSGLYALPHVMRASCHVIPESGGFDPTEAFDLIAEWEASVFFAAPTMIRRLIDHPADSDLSNLKTIIYGGGPMYLEDSLAAIERFGPRLAQLYGQGESPMTISALPAEVHADREHPNWHARLASVGMPQSAVEVAIRRDGEWLPAGGVGEVVVRGATVMSGYWEQPDASRETLRDGWLHTGDYGFFDEHGFLTLKDRAKDLIISGGTNIYPREVEEVLLTHPKVVEVSVIGRPDPQWGESVVAFVVSTGNPPPDVAELDRHCLEHIARFKRPRAYRFVTELPKNNYGKVLKTVLREIETRELPNKQSQ